MRIAIVSMFSGHVYRGAEAWSAQMAEALHRLGNQVTLVQGGPTPAKKNTYGTISVSYAVPDRSGFVSPRRLGRMMALALSRLYLNRVSREEIKFGVRAVRALSSIKPDVIIATGGIWPLLIYSMYKLLASNDVRIVYVDHSGISYQFHDYLRLGVDGILVYRPFYQEEGERSNWNKTVVKMIPCPVDLSLFRENGPSLDVGLQKPIILTTAALVPYKGVDGLIRAVGALDYGSLLVVGDGPLREEIRSLGLSLLGDGRFMMYHGMDHDQMPSVYRTADVYCLASSSVEYFGIAIAEALASGCRLVLHDDAVRRWIAGPCAEYADMADGQNLVDALRRATSATLLAPSDSVVMKFSADACARDLEEFLHVLALRPAYRWVLLTANASAPH